MDLTLRALHDIVLPTAAFASPLDPELPHDLDGKGEDGDHLVAWQDSDLNAKNRIDSLADLDNPLWRIDGAAGLGTQFFAVPLFLTEPSPMRLDLYIDEAASHPLKIRKLLNLGQAYHIKDASRLRHLAYTKHFLRILQHHTLAPTGALRPDVVAELYKMGPFGSQLRITNLSIDVRKSKIVIFRNHDLESSFLPPKKLSELWGLSDEIDLRPQLDIGALVLVHQLQDSVSLVRLRGPTKHGDNLFVMKALNSHVKYMYHELRAHLFDIPEHANIIGKPEYIITKQTLFGNKTAVVGFTIPYHPPGTLRDILPLLRINGHLKLQDQLRWAHQLASALLSISTDGHAFYPDLRLDNILLSETRDVIMIDFEQRGVWSSFSSPEVDYFENIRLVANDTAAAENYLIPTAESKRCWKILASCRPEWTTDCLQKEGEDVLYNNPPEGYNISWRCLTPREREAAMVYMLGRVLWCIFEGVSAPHCGAVWQSYRWEPELEFPSFKATPPEAQKLILDCVGESSARETSKFMRLGSKIYMKQELADSDKGHYELVSDDLYSKAKMYWEKRLRETKFWIRARKLLLQANPEHEEDYGRPSLESVVRRLKDLQCHFGFC